MSSRMYAFVDPKTGKSVRRVTTPLWFVVGIVLVLGAGALVLSNSFGDKGQEIVTNEVILEKQEVEPILRIHGSNTLGASMIPALAERYLIKLGCESVKRIPGEFDTEFTFEGFIPGKQEPQRIEIQAHGSSTAFKGLANKACDIGASSRRIKGGEIELLGRLGLGMMASSGSEHVVGLDGVAVIVHPDNPIEKLSIDTIAAIFAGEIRNWKELGWIDADISLYSRDHKSGTFDTFNSLVMQKIRAVSRWAVRFEDSNELYDRVLNDTTGIGFIGLPYIRSAKALGIYEGDNSRAFRPNFFTVKSEVYPLSRRLYLYTSEVVQNPHAKAFVELAVSDEGQQLARASNLVDLSLDSFASSDEFQFQGPERYSSLTRQAEFVLAIRFDSGAERLDSRAEDDFERFVRLMSLPENKKREVIILGHTDIIGDEVENLRLSRERAGWVRRMLLEVGVPVTVVEGFGVEVPVAGNETPAGRQRNRRVEIFLGS